MDGIEGDADCSVWSSAVDEGLELSQRLCESVFSGPEGEMEAESEELMLGACTRLRTAVDKLLELLSESSQQVPRLHTHPHTRICFCEKWGHPIGVMVFILYKLYVLLPYTYPTPKLSPHRRLCISTFPPKKLTLYDL